MYRVTGDFHSRPLSWTSTIPEHVFVIGNLSSTATGPGNGLIGVRLSLPPPDRAPSPPLLLFPARLWPACMQRAAAFPSNA